MAWRMRDLQCTNKKCGYIFEELMDKNDKNTYCPQCGLVAEIIMSAVPVTKCHDSAVRSEVLKKRSAEHTQKEIINKTGDKWGLKDNKGKRFKGM